MRDKANSHRRSVMFIVFILLAVKQAIGDQYPDVGDIGPDSDEDSSAVSDDAYSALERGYGIKDPKYINPIFRQGGSRQRSSLRMPGGAEGKSPSAQFGEYYGNLPRESSMGSGGPMRGPGGPMMGRPGGMGQPGGMGGPPRFDYDVVSEVEKKFKNSPIAGGAGTGGVNEMYDFEEKLTYTGKWDEFLDEIERRKRTGEVPKDWQQDVQYWSTWIRNAVNEKKASENKKDLPRLTRPRVPSPGMSPYWTPNEESEKTERSGQDSKPMIGGQALLDKAIARIKSLGNFGGGNAIPPQMPEDGSFLGDNMPQENPLQRPEDGNFNGAMPPQMPQMSEDEMFKRDMPQVNPAATIPIGPGLRRPPPNRQWPAKGNLHGNGFGDVPPSPNPAGNGDPYQGNFGGNGFGNGPSPFNPTRNRDPYQGNFGGNGFGNGPSPFNPAGNGDPYQGNFGGNGFGNGPPSFNSAGNGDPYQGNFGGNGLSNNIPPPPNPAAEGDPYQGNYGENGFGNIPPPPNSAGYSDYQQYDGMQQPQGRDPRFGGAQQPSPNSARQGNPSQMPNLGATQNLDQMVKTIMTENAPGNNPEPRPDQNYHSTIFKVPNTDQSTQPPNLNFQSKDIPQNDPPPRGPVKNWPKAIQYRIPPPPTNSSSKGKQTLENKKNNQILLSNLPLVDDFKSPVRWVKFSSHDTEDGLAKVTDPKTGKNRQVKINGSIYVPVVDHSIARIGYVVTTLPPSTEPPRMVAKEQAVINTLTANVDLNKIDERDWLVTSTALQGLRNDLTCDGDSCQSRCHTLGCQSKCTGDTCASGCVADSCTAFCKGPGCLAMCIGKDCNARCDGQSCDSRCRGKGCESKCQKFSCHRTTNGVFSVGGGTWEQNYPQYDTDRVPSPSYND